MGGRASGALALAVVIAAVAAIGTRADGRSGETPVSGPPTLAATRAAAPTAATPTAAYRVRPELPAVEGPAAEALPEQAGLDDPGHGTAVPASAEGESAPRSVDIAAEEAARHVPPAPDGTRLRNVAPDELGYDSLESMEREVRSRLGIADARPIRIVHDVRDGKPVVTVVVEPPRDAPSLARP